jgi:hypothetical protein
MRSRAAMLPERRSAPPELVAVAEIVGRHGLALRGGFHPEAADGVPALADGRAPGTVLLVGNIGGGLWPAFSSAPEFADGAPHPLDRWTRRVLERIAATLAATALFPFGGPPYLPFQRWAMRAEPVAPSPVGILIHPDFGLWHAYRGALAFAARLPLPPVDARVRPCDSCAGQPCLSACPVGAFMPAGYDVPRCVGHLERPAGSSCMSGGCLARRACPVGREYIYDHAQAAFHMTAFLQSNRGKL